MSSPEDSIIHVPPLKKDGKKTQRDDGSTKP